MNPTSWLTLLILLLAPAFCIAQEEDEEVQEAAQIVHFEVAAESFDQWVFNNMHGDPIENLETTLELQMDMIERTCGLTDDQRSKLTLAGYGDLERFVDRLETTRAKFMLVRHDQNRFNEIWQDIQPLQLQVQSGLFGQGSLFAKVIEATLTESQTEQYRAFDLERRSYRFKARLLLALTQIESTVPMTDEQRTKVVDLLMQNKPPQTTGQYDYYVAMVLLARMPEEQLKEIFDATQFATLQHHLQQARGVEPFLIQNGAIGPAEGAAAVPLPAPALGADAP